jgi:hypothetical protein
MSGGCAVLVSVEGRCAWPAWTRCEAPEDSEEAAESIEGVRAGAVGRVSGRCGREGGGMTLGDSGGEDSEGDEMCRSWAWAEGRVGVRAGGLAGPRCSSAANKASSFCKGLAGRGALPSLNICMPVSSLMLLEPASWRQGCRLV